MLETYKTSQPPWRRQRNSLTKSSIIEPSILAVNERRECGHSYQPSTYFLRGKQTFAGAVHVFRHPVFARRLNTGHYTRNA